MSIDECWKLSITSWEFPAKDLLHLFEKKTPRRVFNQLDGLLKQVRGCSSQSDAFCISCKLHLMLSLFSNGSEKRNSQATKFQYKYGFDLWLAKSNLRTDIIKMWRYTQSRWYITPFRRCRKLASPQKNRLKCSPQTRRQCKQLNHRLWTFLKHQRR